MGLIGGVQWLRGNQESISPASDSFDVSRLSGGVAKRPAKRRDRDVNAVIEIDDGVVRPELLLNLFAGGHLPAPFNQDSQDPKRLFLKQDLATGCIPIQRTQLPGFQIELERSETQADWLVGLHRVHKVHE